MDYPIEYAAAVRYGRLPEDGSHWLSPSGELIPVQEHFDDGVRMGIVGGEPDDMAKLPLFSKPYDPKNDALWKQQAKDFLGKAFEKAWKSGWQRVYVEPQGMRVIAHNNHIPPTRKQIATLKDFAIVNKMSGVSHFVDGMESPSGRRLWDNPDVD